MIPPNSMYAAFPSGVPHLQDPMPPQSPKSPKSSGNAKARPPHPDDKGTQAKPDVPNRKTGVCASTEWETGLCDCCANPGGCQLCCCVTWCPCVVYGNIVDTLSPREVCFGGSGSSACLLYFALGIMQRALCMCPVKCFIEFPVRQALRKKYGIENQTLKAMVEVNTALLCLSTAPSNTLTLGTRNHSITMPDAPLTTLRLTGLFARLVLRLLLLDSGGSPPLRPSFLTSRPLLHTNPSYSAASPFPPTRSLVPTCSKAKQKKILLIITSQCRLESGGQPVVVSQRSASGHPVVNQWLTVVNQHFSLTSAAFRELRL